MNRPIWRYSLLPTNTTLQSNIKIKLLNGRNFYLALGILKEISLWGTMLRNEVIENNKTELAIYESQDENIKLDVFRTNDKIIWKR